ncbi:MAG: hypothetical protein ACN6N0_10660 [Microvirgula sp.]
MKVSAFPPPVRVAVFFVRSVYKLPQWQYRPVLAVGTGHVMENPWFFVISQADTLDLAVHHLS